MTNLSKVLLGMALAALATLYFVPGLVDRVIYDHVSEDCWRSMSISGVDGGRYCRGTSTLNGESHGVSTLTTRFGGQGHLIVFGQPLAHDAQQRAISYALVRMPGKDGQWFCASEGTAAVERDLGVKLRLRKLRKLQVGAASKENVATLDATLGRCDETTPCAPMERHHQGSHMSELAGSSPKGEWRIQARAHQAGGFDRIVEAIALKGISPDGVSLSYDAGEDLGAMQTEVSPLVLDLTLKDMGRCGPTMEGPVLMDGDDEATLEIDWDN